MVSDFAVRKLAGMEQNGLKAARLRLKLTQPTIADRLGVSVAQVSRWENGHDNIPSYRLAALTQAYEASLEELLGDQAAPLAEQPGSKINSANLEPILAALIPNAPKGRLTDQSVRALAGALSYGLEMLGDHLSKPANDDVLRAVVRGVNARFRDLNS